MKARVPFRLLGVLVLAIAGFWSGYAALADAPVVDEAPHLASGISYVQLLAYRLNPEHPPLEKLAAGLVAELAHPTLPTDQDWWPGGINEQWRAGAAVLWDGRNDPGVILALGRLGVLALNLLFLILGWRMVSRRYGEGWGLAFLSLLALSPFFLGHAHLITTDVAAASVAVMACVAFATDMERRTRKTFALAALCFGIAQLAKFSLVLLIPTFLLAALFVTWREHRRAVRAYARALLRPVAVMAAGFLLVVYPTYAVLTLRGDVSRSRNDAEFLLSSFAGGPSHGLLCNPARCAAELAIAASGHKLTQPAGTYLLGVLMVVQRSAGGSTIYFDGQVGSAGSRLYFPLVYLTKETVPALLVLAFGLAFLLWRMRGRWRDVGKRYTPELMLGTFATLYILFTLRSSLNIGVRHLFPVIPIAYLFALQGWREEARRDARFAWALGALVVLQGVVGLMSLPSPLSYYNLLGGGTAHGYEIAADSNYDWGQDALRMRDWMDAHPGEQVAVDLFGGSDAQALLGPDAVAWTSARGNPAAYGVHWFAISVDRLLNRTGALVPGEPRLTDDEYRWLQALRDTPYGQVPEPDERIGTSIFLYRL